MNDLYDGATIWARKTLNSDIFYKKPSCWFKIWFYIVTRVCHKDNQHFQRGQGFFNWAEIVRTNCLGTDVTSNSIDHCIRWLKSATMIATIKATRGMIITVRHYNLYQDLHSYKSDNKSDSIGDVKAEQKRNRSDTIYKYVKNDKNNKDIYEEIVAHYNKIMGTRLKSAPRTEIDHWIKSYTLDEIKTAIEAIPYDEWLHDKKELVLLFRRRNSVGDVDNIGRLLSIETKHFNGQPKRYIGEKDGDYMSRVQKWKQQ